MKNALGFPVIPFVDSEEIDIEAILDKYRQHGVSTELNPPGPTYNIDFKIPVSIKDYVEGKTHIPHLDELKQFALWCNETEEIVDMKKDFKVRVIE